MVQQLFLCASVVPDFEAVSRDWSPDLRAAPLSGKTEKLLSVRALCSLWFKPLRSTGEREKSLLHYDRRRRYWEHKVAELDRITQHPDVMGGKACIRGMRVTVGMIVGQIGSGRRIEEILAEYPYLEYEDIMQALRYAAWRAEEREVVLSGQ